jgi:hypothetical protein
VYAGGVSTIPDLLAWAGAPEGLGAWARTQSSAESELLDVDDAALGDLLRACPKAGWLPWVAAVANIPMDLIVASTGLAIETSGDDPETKRALEEAYAAVTGAGSGEECLAAAVRCEAIAKDAPTTFRASGNEGTKRMAATALVLRAAEAVVAVMAREEANRMSRARSQVARFGGGVSAWVARSDTPIVLAMPPVTGGEPEPPTPELAFACDALGRAMELVAELRGEDETRKAFVDAL